MKEQIERLRAFFAACPATVNAIICEFSGSGDSGAIDEAYAVESYSLDDGSGVQVREVLAQQDLSAAHDIAYAALEKQGVDWYNNDGGQGEVAIMRNGEVICNTHQNYVQTNTYNAEFLLGKEELEAGKETA